MSDGSGTAPGPTRGTLYVVATPIGNLADMTLRGIETLRTVPLIAAEDTRHTQRLLQRHDIATRTTSYHARSAPSRAETLLRHLRDGHDLALVTDAGTPVVSDPGADLIAAWAAEGGTVVPIPGASAVLAAVVASGIAGPRWSFEGFLPRSGRDRRERLARLAADERASIVYEAPNRVAATLRDLAEACGEARPGAVCRELTKVHETITRAGLGALASAAAAGDIPARGEFVLVVGQWTGSADPEQAAEDASVSLVDALAEVERLVSSGVARGAAARQVSTATGLPRRSLYEAGSRER